MKIQVNEKQIYIQPQQMKCKRKENNGNEYQCNGKIK